MGLQHLIAGIGVTASRKQTRKSASWASYFGQERGGTFNHFLANPATHPSVLAGRAAGFE